MKTAHSFKSRTNYAQNGMTLIDISIFLIVIGLLAAPLIKAYDNFRQNKIRATAVNNIIRIDKAINDFFFENNRYPCPSNITLARTDPMYGRENCTGTGQALFGGVPFVTLKIPEAMSLDGWDNRLKFVMTRALTVAPMPSPGTGVLTVWGFNQFDALPADPFNALSCTTTPAIKQSNVHYLIISHGATGRGAYNINGTQVATCPAAGASRDRENCNDDLVFFHHVCAQDEGTGATFYDDIMSRSMKTAAPQRLWNISSDPRNISTNMLSIGINIDTPGPTAPDPSTRVHVRGNVTSNNLYSVVMCDENDQNCFNPAYISASMPRMNCTHPSYGGDGSTGMRGVGDDPLSGIAGNISVRCQGSYLPTLGNCPGTQYMIGINAQGEVQCSP